MHSEAECTNTQLCFFCIMKEADPFVRRPQTVEFFKQMPLRDDQEHVLVLSGLKSIAMAQPDDPEFPSLGIFSCMAQLIHKGINSRNQWLLRDQNIYIPYYAAHIIGSYAMNKSQFAEKAVQSGVIPPLMELLSGKISWVEQRVAIRALCHIASHEGTFEAVADDESGEDQIVGLAMEIASNCLTTVYKQFLGIEERKRLKYHSELLTKGLGGAETENRKAEEWGIQLQDCCLYLLKCFASKERFLNLICQSKFLNKLCGIRGGIESCKDSPGGLGLIREICNSSFGRDKIGDLKQVLESLCNVARSSDYWQETAIECLLLLLKDQETRNRVIEFAARPLADLVELRRIGIGRPNQQRIGETITQILLRDYHKIKYGGMRLKNPEAQQALEETWELKVERKKNEKLTKNGQEELKQRRIEVRALKREGNDKFWSGETDKAVSKYSKALEICPVKLRKERVVLYSNRAQSYLVLKEAEPAISDATKALSLSGAARPHLKSLWRRAQAYDLIGLGWESLMDCLRFLEAGREVNKKLEIPCFAARLVKKQVNATWPFAGILKPKAKGLSTIYEEKQNEQGRSSRRRGKHQQGKPNW